LLACVAERDRQQRDKKTVRQNMRFAHTHFTLHRHTAKKEGQRKRSLSVKEGETGENV
jgi:hypothetical protein